MIMTPRLRKFALTTHITSSVGWFGAVAGFLALAIAGVTSQDVEMVRAAYLAMGLISWFVIVPFSIASLLSGLVGSLGTKWGLFRHYWILIKLLITIIATVVLLVHMQPISYMASVAAEKTLSSADLGRLRIQLVADAGAAILALLVATTLSVYKPWGVTPYGRRKQHEDENGVGIDRQWPTRTPWGRYVLFGLIGVFLLVVVLHLTGGGLGGLHTP